MKTILLTGATSGIGYEASIVLAKEGHRVVMVGRDAEKTARCVAEVKQKSGSSNVESVLCDVASLASVRKASEEIHARFPKLDVLVNNAGTVFDSRKVTAEGFEATWVTNHLGPFLLTQLLLDLVLAAAPGARIVVVSSTGHYRGTMDLEDPGYEKGGYSIMGAYMRSKLANVHLTRVLARRLEGKGVTVNALHPGAVATNIWAGAPGWSKPILAVLKGLFMISPQEGAKTITYLATSPEVEGKTGLYFEKNKPKKPSALALDDALADQVWQHAELWTGTAKPA